MNRTEFLTRMGLGALAGLFARNVGAEEPLTEDGPPVQSWRKDGAWTVVYVEEALRAGHHFDPSGYGLPGLESAPLCSAYECTVVTTEGENNVAYRADTYRDRLHVYGDGLSPKQIDGPFWIFWPDQWVVLVSVGAVGLPIPFEYETGPGQGVRLPRHKGGLRTGWQNLEISDLSASWARP